MDGSGSAFLREPIGFTGLADGISHGILYIEDFDAEPPPDTVRERVPDDVAPSFTSEELEAARQDGRIEGVQASLADAQLLQAQLEAAILQSLADALQAGRAALERIARQKADDAARSVMAILQAAVPATMSRHAGCEQEAVLLALLPGLRCQPDLRVRAHPDLADTVRERLVDLLPADSGVLSVAADPKLAAGDIRIAWQDGSAHRDCAAIWDDIRVALAPLGLPAFEEIACGGQ